MTVRGAYLVPDLNDVPAYVSQFRSVSDKMMRRSRWMIQHFLPAASAVRTLFGFFAGRQRLEKWCQNDRHGFRRLKPDWNARFSPGSYLLFLDSEARSRTYSFLIMTLRKHAVILSKPPCLDRYRDPRRRNEMEWRLRHALDALASVGTWWMDADRNHRPYTTARERRALDLCVRIRRLKEKAMQYKGEFLSADTLAKATRWMTRGVNADLRRSGRSSRKA